LLIRKYSLFYIQYILTLLSAERYCLMNPKIKSILDRIRDLETELRAELLEQKKHFKYEMRGKKTIFEKATKEVHKEVRMNLIKWFRISKPGNILSAPFIYSLIIPLFILDLFITVYQAVCFRLYGISAVNRSRYIAIDRHRLEYLNLMEKLNCEFCGYANGLLAYAVEIASRTEQYWCPIKHARKDLNSHRRYPYFIEYGDASDLFNRMEALREELKRSQ